MKRTSSRSENHSSAGALALALSLSVTPFASIAADASAKTPGTPWVVPRTADGKPDLQGNWSNETQTPFERMGNQGPTLTDEQAAALERRAQDVEEFRDRPTEPGEVAVKGGSNELAPVPGEPTFVERLAQAAGGVVGGYKVSGSIRAIASSVSTVSRAARSSSIPPMAAFPR